VGLREDLGEELEKVGKALRGSSTAEAAASDAHAWDEVRGVLEHVSDRLDVAREKVGTLVPPSSSDSTLRRDLDLLADQTLDLRGQLESLRIRARPQVPTPPERDESKPALASTEGESADHVQQQ
jgi:hypothetical protein